MKVVNHANMRPDVRAMSHSYTQYACRAQPPPNSTTPAPNLSRCDLRRANLIDACLGRANLAAAALDGAFLLRADLSGADLTDASLAEAQLQVCRGPATVLPALRAHLQTIL